MAVDVERNWDACPGWSTAEPCTVSPDDDFEGVHCTCWHQFDAEAVSGPDDDTFACCYCGNQPEWD